MDVQKYSGKFTGRAAGSVLLTLAAALALWLFIAANHRKAAIEDISKSLETINSYKTAEISAWLDDHKREALRLSRHPFLGEIISAERAKPGSKRALLSAWLKDHTEQKQYASMAFLSPRRTIIAATPGYLVETKKEFTGPLGLALKNGAPQVTDIYLATSGRPRIAMFSPISAGDSGGKPVCVLAIKINLENRFYPILKAAPLFFTEAETLLVRKEGENALFLNPLNHVKDSALKFTRPLTEERLPAAAALRGVTGFFQGVDYRGVRVFSSIGTVPGTNWAVITKVDRDTMIAPAKSKEQLYLAMILLGAGLLYFLVYAVIRARRHAAEAALEKSRHLLAETESERRKIERIFTEFMEHSPVYVFFKDKDLRSLHLSRNYEAMLGRPMEELLGKSMDELFPSDLAKSMIEDDKRIIEEGKEVVVDEELNGRFYRTIKFPIKIEGSPSYLAGYTIDITEAKLAEEALRKSERELREAQKLARLGNWSLDLPSNKLHWSDEIYSIFDIDREKFGASYEAFLEAIHPEDRELVNKAYTDSLKTKSPYNIVHRLLMKDGTVKYVSECCETFYDKEGRPLRSVGTVQDITELKLAEEKLRESEERLRITLEETQIGTWDWNVETDTWSASPTYYTMLGYDPEQGPGDRQAWLDRVHPEDKEMISGKIRGVLSGTDAKYQYEARIKHADGTYRWQAVLGKTVKSGAGGKAARIIGVRMDITERKLAEQKLRESETRYRALVDASGDGILTADLENMKFRFANRAICRMLGYTAEELTSLSVTDIHPKEALPDVIAEFEAQARGDKTLAPNLPCLRKDGSVFYADIATTPVIIDGRRCNLGIFRDITEQKRLEEELRRTLDMTPALICVAKPDGYFEKVNPEWERALGFSEKEIMAMGYAKLIHPDDMEPTMAEVRKQVGGGHTINFTNRYRHKDGTYRLLEWNAVPAADGRLYAAARDVTERRKAEDSLRESERLLRESQSRAHLGSYALDITTGVWKSSAALDDIFGISEAYQRTVEGWLALIHQDDRAMMSAYLRDEVIGRSQPFDKEYRIIRQDTRAERWVHGLGGLELDARGRPVKMNGTIQDIHESKLAELELRKSEESYRETVELAVDGFLLGSPEGKIIGANSQMQNLAGRTLNELLGLHVSALFSPGTMEAAPLRFDLLNEGQTVISERSLLRPDGTTLPVEMHSKRMPNGTYQSIYRDITGSKLAEKERLSHLHFLESLDRVNRAIQGAEDLEQMMSGVLTAVLDIFDCDRAWLFYPCDPEATSFQVPMEITRPEYPGAKILNTDIPMPPDMARNLREALESPEPVTYTLGTEKNVNKVSAEQFGVKALMMTALYPNVGKPWVFGIHQCSYPRVWTPEEMRLLQEIGRRLEDSLSSLLSYREVRVSEQSLKEAQRLAGLGNWTMDLAGNKFSWSDEVHRIFETDPGGFVPSYEAFLDAIHPEDREYVDKAYTDSVKNRSRYDIMHRLRMKDGRIKYVRECCETFYARDGRPFASRGMILDLTDVKLAELKLEKLNQDLMASKQEMENFLYITSHDLRTPLVNIQGFTQNLENYLRELVEELSPARLDRPVNEAVSKLTKEIPVALKFVLESSHKMDSLISSLLKVARLGRVEMKPRNLEMNDLLKKIVNSTFYQLEATGAAAKVGVLPACKADPDAISQIFSNLLENAIKYRAEGRALSVSVTGEASGDRVLYKVADNGSGIAAKDMGRIWDIFYRGTGAGEGEGIGLTVVKYMTEKNGGSIRAESEEGRGTVFYLELPAAGGTK